MTEKKTILIVDDQESIIKSLKRLLLPEKYDILYALDGPAALEIIKKHLDEIFLIISDQRMPGMTGTMFLEKTLEMIPNAIRFILSGYSDIDRAVNTMNNGIVHRYLTKPWNNEELLLMIHQAYNSPDKARTFLDSVNKSGAPQSPNSNIMDMEMKKFDEQRKDRSLGRIAVHHGFINQSQLNEALIIMQSDRQAGKKVSLENILFEKGFISSENMGKLVAVTRRKIGTTFGKIAIKNFGVSPADIDRCLAIQAKEFSNTTTCRLLGDIIVAEKILTDEQKDSIIVDMVYSEREVLTPDKDGSFNSKSANNEEATEKLILNKKKKHFFRQRALDKVFCKSAISRNFATEPEILKSLEEQLLNFTKHFEIKLIKDILVERSIISQNQAEVIAAAVGIVPSAPIQNLTDTNSFIQQSTTILESSQQPATVPKQATDTEHNVMHQETIIAIGENSAFELTLDPAEMEAKIQLVGDMPEGMTAENLKTLLAEYQIIYGLVDDVTIELFLRQADTQKEKFIIAKGKAVKPGRNAMVKYYFEDKNTHFGKELDSGKFDYRERGEVLNITQGTILAEKIPLIPAVSGITVSGKEILAPVPMNMELDCGKGVEITKDGLKAVAVANGRPDLTLGGRISVMPEQIIKGNVDFKTGNVKFSGDVIVQGIILAGFKVIANNLTVNDIEEAEVNIANALLVKNSINDSKIKTGGTLAAQILKKSTVSARGDVVIQKEIIDCTIITSGKVIVPRGRIIASTIHAAKGIEAMNIGSEVASPSHLFPGADDHALDTLKIFTEKINLQQKSLIKFEELQHQYNQQSLQNLNSLSEMSKRQEELAIEKKNILKTTKPGVSDSQKKDADRSLADIDKKILKMDETINRLFNEHDNVQNLAKEISAKIKSVKTEIQRLISEKKGFEKWYESQKQERRQNGAEVLVQGTLFAGTQITGTECSIKVKSHIRNSRIHQVLNIENSDNMFYTMKVDSLSSKGSQPHVYRS